MTITLTEAGKDASKLAVNGALTIYEAASAKAALLEAEADADAGRVVPHSEVRKWMQTIIDGNPQPMPKVWLE